MPLKVIMNVFNPANTGCKSQGDSNVSKVNISKKKIIQEALKIQIIFVKSKINYLKCVITSLKVLNIVVVISTHEEKHSYFYCDGLLKISEKLESSGLIMVAI